MSRAGVLRAKRLGTALLILTMTGCFSFTLAAGLLTDTQFLDFSDSEEVLTLVITNPSGGGVAVPFVVVSGDPWIQILDCAREADHCTSTGPADPITVRIRVDRSMMTPGENMGAVRIDSPGIASKSVQVRAGARVISDFTVDNRTPLENEDVQFTSLSRTLPGWTITSWLWQFGGGQTSQSPSPPPQTYPEPGNFTIALTITATNGLENKTITTRREDYILVSSKDAPTADFHASTQSPLVNNPVFFTDTSSPGTAPIESWEWIFGDGGSSRERDPAHTYTTPGTFTVSLKVVTTHGTDTRVRANFLTVVVIPPLANFKADDTNPPVGIPVQFTDLSDPGSAPIESWVWVFEDGDATPGTSFEQDPIFVYQDPGTFSVRLTVTTAHGTHTLTRAAFIVARIIPPTADFTASTRRPVVNEDVQFTDTSERGTADINVWEWTFGDGASSQLQSPTHRYTRTGTFSGSLRVTSPHGTDFIEKINYFRVFVGTALDEYVDAPDNSFGFTLINSTPGPGATVHTIDLTSQTWRSALDVDNPVWKHHLQIIEPDEVVHSRGFLVITGGNNTGGPPLSVDPTLFTLAVQTGAVLAILPQIPNQPLQFAGEEITRTEDEIIAYTFAQFLDSFNPVSGAADDTWPLLLPMVKSAVRAMDTVQMFLGDRIINPITIEDFVVFGASKRGWTTWLTAAVDDRAAAIAPMVFDFLNALPQLNHHLDVYGFFSEALFDYVEEGVVQRRADAASAALNNIVDPFEYRERFENIPKLLINSSGDQFFLPDSAQFYFDQLPGEKKLSYIPNTGHSLADPDGSSATLIAVLTPWLVSQLTGGHLPQFQWAVAADNRIVVTPGPGAQSVRMWVATSNNRDFRFDSFVNQFEPPGWTSLDLSPDQGGNFVANVAELPSKWTAFFVQLQFNSGISGLPFIFTTEIRVAPDTLPIQVFDGPTANFVQSTTRPFVDSDVEFTDISIAGSGPIIRWLWDFGDGSFEESENTTANPTHTYTAEGVFTVTLTVKTVHGESTLEVEDLITVEPAAP